MSGMQAGGGEHRLHGRPLAGCSSSLAHRTGAAAVVRVLSQRVYVPEISRKNRGESLLSLLQIRAVACTTSILKIISSVLVLRSAAHECT